MISNLGTRQAVAWNTVVRGLFCLIATSVVGCSLTVPASLESDAKTAAEKSQHAPPDEIWCALGNAVERGTIDSTERLGQFVAVLARNGELSIDEVHRFDAAFPKITAGSRPLSSADVITIKSLGLKSR